MPYRVKALGDRDFRRSGHVFSHSEWKVLTDEQMTPEILGESKLRVEELRADGKVVPHGQEDPRLVQVRGELQAAKEKLAELPKAEKRIAELETLTNTQANRIRDLERPAAPPEHPSRQGRHEK